MKFSKQLWMCLLPGALTSCISSVVPDESTSPSAPNDDFSVALKLVMGTSVDPPVRKVMAGEFPVPSFYIKKGGVTLLRKGLYLLPDDAKNSLIIDSKTRETWEGQERKIHEVVLVCGDQLLVPGKLPRDFDLSKAIVISFEGEVVRFFDFSRFSGGTIQRGKPQ